MKKRPPVYMFIVVEVISPDEEHYHSNRGWTRHLDKAKRYTKLQALKKMHKLEKIGKGFTLLSVLREDKLMLESVLDS